ncbi:MAG: cellulase family glycosylhydrolase [Acidimicrobiia bacterium]|nr:MAG: cellulase family glycosylhydrolase [Acidimicrobiia bacterium]
MTSELTIDGAWFRDPQSRNVLLRGVNLGGSSKMPRTVDEGRLSFVGRPFPLEEADKHFARLAYWGMNVVRLLVPWEAIEHSAPGVHDVEYLDYLAAILAKARDHGISILIDPHQDVWSTASGGSGAPSWTLDLAGFDVPNLDTSEAALLSRPGRVGYKPVMWHTNAYRLASATMYTLFFAGDQLAPQTRIEGQSAQKFLQDRFIESFICVAEITKSLPHVIGFGTPNEPRPGYIGLERLTDPIPEDRGPALTAFDAMSIPAGFTKTVKMLERQGADIVETKDLTLNPTAVSAWKNEDADIWRQHGVWRIGSDGRPELLVDDYFRNVRAFADGLSPFAERYAQAIRQVHPDTAIFLEGTPHTTEPLAWHGAKPVVNASHWYDIAIVRSWKYDPDFTIEWGTHKPVYGRKAVQSSYEEQVGRYVTQSETELDGAPTFLGEFGIPFNIDDSVAYRTGDFSAHSDILNCYYNALDASLVHATLWDYNPNNTNEDGDHWNECDFSIFSIDQITTAPEHYAELDRGGRAVEGFCRPRLVAAAGAPIEQRFDRPTKSFTLTIDTDTGTSHPTVVYVPLLQYPDGFTATVTSGSSHWDASTQRVIWANHAAGRQTLSLSPAPKIVSEREGP